MISDFIFRFYFFETRRIANEPINFERFASIQNGFVGSGFAKLWFV